MTGDIWSVVFSLLDGATTAVLFGLFLYIWYRRSMTLAQQRAEHYAQLAELLRECMYQLKENRES